MSDIVERLTCSAAVFYEYSADDGALLKQAAHEIAALREEAITQSRGLAEAVKTNIALRERVRELEEAFTPLKPTAFSSVPDDHPLVIVYGQYAQEPWGVARFTAGEYRRAAKAMEGK
jgi:hypothetical protein